MKLPLYPAFLLASGTSLVSAQGGGFGGFGVGPFGWGSAPACAVRLPPLLFNFLTDQQHRAPASLPPLQPPPATGPLSVQPPPRSPLASRPPAPPLSPPSSPFNPRSAPPSPLALLLPVPTGDLLAGAAPAVRGHQAVRGRQAGRLDLGHLVAKEAGAGVAVGLTGGSRLRLRLVRQRG
jgi:hypothetical protein